MITSDFVFAGRAVFTVSNDKGEHFTYKVSKHKDDDIYFAKVLSGADDYSYMGVLDKTAHIVHKGKKGMSSSAKSVKVLNWALRVIDDKTTLPEGYSIVHSGVCGRCGRELTDPVSIETGLGPVCRSHQ
jgi:hypothetical protein